MTHEGLWGYGGMIWKV